MNKKIFAAVALSVSLILIAGTMLVLADCPYKKAGMKHECAMKMEGVSFTITNIEKGVKIEMTADKPELVKKVQDHEKMVTEMMEKGKTGECPYNKAQASTTKAACSCPGPCMVEGAVRKVTNTENGVVVEVTAEKAEAIKEIQTKAEKMNKTEAPAPPAQPETPKPPQTPEGK
jgi:hypothetical protein